MSRLRSKKRTRPACQRETGFENELAGGFHGEVTAPGWPSQSGDDGDALAVLDHPPAMRSERELARLDAILDHLETGRGKP